MRYCVRDRSVWRMESFRFNVWFVVLGGDEARSSIFSI